MASLHIKEYRGYEQVPILGGLDPNTDYLVHAKVQKGNEIALAKFPVRTKMGVACSTGEPNGIIFYDSHGNKPSGEAKVGCYLSSDGFSPNYANVTSLRFSLSGEESDTPLSYRIVTRGNQRFDKTFTAEKQPHGKYPYQFTDFEFDIPISLQFNTDTREIGVQMYVDAGRGFRHTLALKSWTFETQGKEYTYSLKDVE